MSTVVVIGSAALASDRGYGVPASPELEPPQYGYPGQPTPAYGSPAYGSGVAYGSGGAVGSGMAMAEEPLPRAELLSGATHDSFYSTRPYSRVPITEVGQPVQSSVYFRADYFHWNERTYGQDFVNESGVLWTLGYWHRNGNERVRAEFFAGQVDYRGGVEYPNGTSEPLDSVTNYTGVRGEFELLYEPDWAPRSTFFAGIGSRFWFRDLPDSVTASGNLVWGYQETWWTVYPYLGWEKKRDLSGSVEFYGSARLGVTAYTYEHATMNDAIFYPRLGATGQVEAGLRGPRWFLAGFFDSLTWRESGLVRDSFQPNSALLLVGLKSGFSY